MANRTVTDAKTIRGTNPQYLVEKITRTRIYESKYWKEECFALSGMAFRHSFRDLFDVVVKTFTININFFIHIITSVVSVGKVRQRSNLDPRELLLSLIRVDNPKFYFLAIALKTT